MKYKSCNLIQHGLCFYNEMLVSCCFAPCDQINGQFPPIIFRNYKGELFTKDELFKRIKEYSEIFKAGGCPKECTNCYHIKEQEWDGEEYINSITITHFSVCNADCIYCSNNLEKEERTNDMYEIIPVLKNMQEQGIIRKGCEFHIGGGEFTVYKECDEMLELFALTNFAKFYVPTNAIKYSEKLFQALDNGSTNIIVSLDSGCKKTFKKIKRIDAFDKVVENLKKYGKTTNSLSAIALKYIIIPTINDNTKEFTKFMETAKKIGIKRLIIDVDARYSRFLNYDINSYLVYFVRNIEKKAQKQGFQTETYSFFSQCLQNINNKNNIFERIYSFLKYKYFNNYSKILYSSHKYGLERKK